MKVVECDFPANSLIDRRMVAAAYYRDSYRAPLSHPQASVTDIFHAIFAHRPIWMRLLFIIRNHIVAIWGLHAEPANAVMNPVTARHYAVGDNIGSWPIFNLTETELIAGRNDRHLDFRISIFREVENAADCVTANKTDGATVNTPVDATSSVIVSTVCEIHNTLGKIYLFFVIPFHRFGAQWLIAKAVKAKRL